MTVTCLGGDGDVMVEELAKLHCHVAEALLAERPSPSGSVQAIGNLPGAGGRGLFWRMCLNTLGQHGEAELEVWKIRPGKQLVAAWWEKVFTALISAAVRCLRMGMPAAPQCLLWRLLQTPSTLRKMSPGSEESQGGEDPPPP